MVFYNCLFIIAVCKRCKGNLAALSKREPDLDDDGNEGDDDDDEESEDQEVIIAAKHLVFQKEVTKCFALARYGKAMPLNGRYTEYSYTS